MRRLVRLHLVRSNGVYYAYRSTGLFGWRFAVATTAREALRRVGVDPDRFVGAMREPER